MTKKDPGKEGDQLEAMLTFAKVPVFDREIYVAFGLFDDEVMVGGGKTSREAIEDMFLHFEKLKEIKYTPGAMFQIGSVLQRAEKDPGTKQPVLMEREERRES